MSERIITIKVIPNSSKNKIIPLEEDNSFKVYLTASPVGGAANKALIKALSKEFGVPQSDISIIRGTTAKIKTVRVQ